MLLLVLLLLLLVVVVVAAAATTTAAAVAAVMVLRFLARWAGNPVFARLRRCLSQLGESFEVSVSFVCMYGVAATSREVCVSRAVAS